jgi:3-methyladenine DNA glycosylase Mpg
MPGSSHRGCACSPRALDVSPKPSASPKDLCSPESDLFLVDDGFHCANISATPRVNVTRAPVDEWRFVISGNRFVSGKKQL